MQLPDAFELPGLAKMSEQMTTLNTLLGRVLFTQDEDLLAEAKHRPACPIVSRLTQIDRSRDKLLTAVVDEFNERFEKIWVTINETMQSIPQIGGDVILPHITNYPIIFCFLEKTNYKVFAGYGKLLTWRCTSEA